MRFGKRKPTKHKLPLVPDRRVPGDVPTCELIAELSKREGVERHEAYPAEAFLLDMTGPAIVLVVVD